MTPLRSARERLLAAHRRGGRLALLSDYDGTLTPLVEHPRLARLDTAARRVLERLAGWPRVHVGILSGRTIQDLKEMVDLPGLCFAGTGGLELEIHGTYLTHPDAPEAHASLAVKNVLKDLFDYSRQADGFLTLRRSERADKSAV